VSNYVNFLTSPRFLIAFAVLMTVIYVSTIFTGEVSEAIWGAGALLTIVFVALCTTAIVRWLFNSPRD